MSRARVPFRWCAASLILASLAGCSVPSYLCVSAPGPKNVTLIASPDANGDNAIAVALVFINDDVAASKISAMTSEDFFTHQSQLQRDYGAVIQMTSWELAGGQAARDVDLHPRCGLVRTLLFARYTSPGDHRQALGNVSNITISLDTDDFTVSP